VAVILTKGTKSLAEQTLSRVKEDFREFILADQIDVFDIFAVPDLTPYELSRKLVLDDDRKAHIAALEHLSRTCKDPALKGKVWLLTATDRNVARYREEGRFSNAPDTKQQKDLARTKAQDIPVLMLLRQNGDEAKGWRGLPFWWPVIVTPSAAPTAIFATEEAVAPTTPASTVVVDRTLSTEEIA